MSTCAPGRKHTQLVELNQRVMDALQMYHTLMRENPAYSFKAPAPGAGGPAPYSSLPPTMMAGMAQVSVLFPFPFLFLFESGKELRKTVLTLDDDE